MYHGLLVVKDRKTVRTVVLDIVVTLLLVDLAFIHHRMSQTWTDFNEAQRSGGPLFYGPHEIAAFLAKSVMFIWRFLQFVKAKKYKLIRRGLVAFAFFAAMYTISWVGYLAIPFGILVLGILKDRTLLVILRVFLLTWQAIVPTAVRERVTMTENVNGKLESSAQERVDQWKESWNSIVQRPLAGNGFATFQYGHHVVANLDDTQNLFVKVMVETRMIGLIMVFNFLQQMLSLGYRLIRRAFDAMHRGLGLCLILAICSCVVANCFGGRWTYLEISGLLWILVAAGVRANQLRAEQNVRENALIAM